MCLYFKFTQAGSALPGPTWPLDSHPDNVRAYCTKWFAQPVAQLTALSYSCFCYCTTIEHCDSGLVYCLNTVLYCTVIEMSGH